MFVNDVGTVIRFDFDRDITDATTFEIKVKTPSGASKTFIPSVVESKSLVYVTQMGDFDAPGRWTLQPRIVSPNYSGHGDPQVITVQKPLF